MFGFYYVNKLSTTIFYSEINPKYMNKRDIWINYFMYQNKILIYYLNLLTELLDNSFLHSVFKLSVNVSTVSYLTLIEQVLIASRISSCKNIVLHSHNKVYFCLFNIRIVWVGTFHEVFVFKRMFCKSCNSQHCTMWRGIILPEKTLNLKTS